MMQWALRAHPNLWGGQESDFLIPLVTGLREVWEFGRSREKLHWISGQDVSWDEFLEHVGRGVNSLYTSRSRGLRWVEQTPQYALHLDNVRRLFPDAKFLFMVRDGRDVVHSLRHFVNPVEHVRASEIWRDFISAGMTYQTRYADESLMLVSYANAVQDTEAELQRVFDFIGEPFSDESVDFIRSKSPINSSFSSGDQEPGHPRWSGWTLAERESFDEIAGDLLLQLGLEQDRDWVHSGAAGSTPQT